MRPADRKTLRRQLIELFAVVAVIFGFQAAAAQGATALPTGGQFVAGAGAITAAGTNGLQISQTTGRGVIDWRSFSIGAGGSVSINNGAGATLNRVTGGDLSKIAGTLSATGSVYLVNPQGIVVTGSGQVIGGGGVVLSTRDISNSAFIAGGAMTAAGASVGDVTNKGKVIARSGDVVIIGHAVTNTGDISAASGTASLVAGNTVVLAPVGGASGVVVAADASATGNVTEAGQVTAAAAALTAAGGNVYTLAGHTSLVEATGTATIAGHVWLTAPNGEVAVAGAVAARNADGTGGQIIASGKTVALAGTATLDATGTAGGQILVGVSAPQTNLAEATTIADGATITAGGDQGGGSIETSGHTLTVGAAKITAGSGGAWLLDPSNLTINAAAASTIVASLNANTNVTSTTTATTTSGPGTASAGPGDIIVAAPISWTGTGTLTLNSYNNTTIQAAISGAGNVTVNAGGGISVQAAVSGRVVAMTASGGNIAIWAGGITGTAPGVTAVTLNTTGAFSNGVGPAGVVASGAGANWRIYSTNPANDTTGGLAEAFIQYNAPAGTAAQGTGNGLLYSVAPVLSYAVTGAVTKVYDGANAVTGLTSANLSTTGLINGDTASIAGTGTFSQADVGNSLTVTLASAPTVTHGGIPVFGYTAGSQLTSGVIGSITPAPLTVTLTGNLNKTYDGTTNAAVTSANFLVSGTVGAEVIAVTQPASIAYDSAEAGLRNLAVTLSATSYVGSGGAKLTNYILPTTPSGLLQGTILQAPLTVLGAQASDKVYDGTTAATLNLTNVTAYGVVGSDDVNLNKAGVTGAFATANVGTQAVTLAGFGLTGAKANDYVVVNPVLSATITKASLTVSGVSALDKAYDGTTTATLNAGAASLTGVVAADAGNTAKLALTTSTTGVFAKADVGTGIAVTGTGFALTGADAGNYTLTQPRGFTAAITPAVLTVTLNGATTKTYDGSTVATIDPSNYTVTGWAAGQGGSIDQTASATYASSHAGTPTVTAILEVTDFKPNTGTSLANYTVQAGTQTFHDVVTGAGLINTAALTISIVGNPTKTYDGTSAATLDSSNYLIQGFITGEGAAITQTAGVYDSPNAGQRGVSATLTAANFATTGATQISDYHFTNPVTGFGTINQAALGVTAALTNQTKVYDGTTTLSGLTSADFILTGFAAGQGSDVTVTQTTGAYASKNVGIQPISVVLDNSAGTAHLRGSFTSTTTDLTNYVLPSVAWGTGTITAKALSVSIVGTPTKTYNGTTDATVSGANYSISGLVAGETVTITQTVASYASPNAGTPTVTANLPASDIVGGAGTLLSNYVLPTVATGGGLINPAPLTILNAFGVNKTYDTTTAATLNTSAASLFGVVSTDSISLTSPTTGNFDTQHVGVGKTVTPTTPFTLTANGGTLLSNYILTQPTLTANITQAILTVTAPTVSNKVYDGTTVATVTSDGRLTGVFAADVNYVTLNSTNATGVFKQSDVGNGIKVTVSGFTLSGSALGDYTVFQPGGLTANITPATLTGAIVNNPTKTYDGTTTVALNAGNYSLTGFVHGEGTDVTVTQAATSAYAQADAGTSIGVTATLAIPDFQATTTKLSNYILPTTVTGTGTINKAQLIAQIVNNPTKTYDGDTATLGTTAALTANNYSVLGFVGGQGVTVSQAAGTYNTPNAGIDVITAALGAGNIAANAGTNLNNYILPTQAVGGGTINRATLTAAIIGNPTKVYDSTTAATLGTANYQLTGFIGTEANGVTVTQTSGTYGSPNVLGVQGSGVSASLGAGDFASSAGTLLSNYNLPTLATGQGTITAKTLNVAVTKVYDATTGLTGATFSLTGVAGSDTVALSNPAGITGSYAGSDAGTGINVSLAGLALSNNGLGNYTLPSAVTNDPVGTITPRPLSVTLAPQTKVYDGTTTAAGLTPADYTITNFAGGQTATINQTTGAYNSKDTNATTVTVSLTTGNYVGANGFNPNNYILPTVASGPGTITAAPLLVNLTSVVKVYDGTNVIQTPTTTYTLSGVVGGDTVTVTNATGTFNTIHVATGIGVNISSITLGGAQGADYTPVLPAANAPIGQITPATLTLMIVGNPTKAYDGATATVGTTAALTSANYQVNGLVGGDTVTVKSDAETTTGAVFNSRNVAGTNGSGLTLTGLSASDINFTGALPGDYVVANTAVGVGTITPVFLTVILNPVTKTYDGSTTAPLTSASFTLTGFVNGETGSVINATGTYASQNVLGAGGSTVTSVINGTNFTYNYLGFSIGNYSFNPVLTNTASTINPAVLTATLAPQTKVYDGTTAAAGLTTASYTLTGLVHGETATVGRTTGAYNNPNVVGATSVSVTGLTGGDFSAGAGSQGTSFIAANYVLPTTISGAGSITPKPITGSIIGDPTKTYDGTTSASLSPANYQLLGFLNGDGATVGQTAGIYQSPDANGVTLASNPITANPVGFYTATGTTVFSNYALPTSLSGAGTINPKTLVVTLGAKTKVYDANTSITLTAADFTLTGLVGAQSAIINQTVGTYTNKNVQGAGGSTVNAVLSPANFLGVGGFNTNNYVLPAVATNTASTITPAPLTVINVLATNKVYDTTTADVLNTAAAALNGVLGTDTVSLSSAAAAGQFGNKNVGTAKPVTASGFTIAGADAGNYTVTQPTGLTANITPAPLTLAGVTANNKVYDATPAATLNLGAATLTGVLGADAVSVTRATGAGVFANKNVGNGKTVTATLGSIVLTGADGGNYTVTGINALTANITPAPLTIANVTASNKVYDAATADGLNTATAALAGVLGSDTVTLSSAGAVGQFADKNVGNGKAVTASGFAISGVDAGNYTVSQPSGLTANITPATLTIVNVAAINKVYDATTADGLNTATAALNGVLGTDTVLLSSAAVTGQFADKNVGNGKAVTASGFTVSGADASNYIVAPVTGLIANITPAPLTLAGVTANNKVYDATTAATLNLGGATLTGVLGTDAVNVTGATGTGQFNTKDVANNKSVTPNLTTIVLGGGDAGNYTVTGLNALTANITPATLTVALAPQTKVYDGTTTAGGLTPNSYVPTGLVGGETVSIDQAVGAYNSPNVVGATSVSATLTAGNFTGANGFLSGNYTLPTVAVGAGTITPKTVAATIVGNPTKVYDSATGAVLTPANYALTGFVGPDGATVNQPAGTYNSKDVPTATNVTASLSGAGVLTLTGGAIASNYILPTTATGAAAITPAPLTVSGLTVFDKVYDGTTAATLNTAHAGVLMGVYAGDAVTLAAGPNAATFTSPNVGSAIPVILNGGSLAGANAADYVLSPVAGITAAITPKTLTAAITGAPTKTYDATTVATLAPADYTLTGFVAGQSGIVTQTTGTYASPNAGSEGVTATLGAGALAAGAGTLLSNYVLPTTAAGVGQITPAPLTAVIIGTPAKTYDGTTVAVLTPGNYALTGFVAGQTGTVTQTAGTYASPNAGSESVTAALGAGTIAAGSGTLLSNYLLPAQATGPGLINPAPLTAVIVGTPTKPYDGTTTATLTPGNYALTGLVGGDRVTVTQSGGTYAAATAGPETVSAILTPGNFTPAGGTLLGNYRLPTGASGAGLITAPSSTSQLDDIQGRIRHAIFALADPRTYIPYPAPGALSTWRNNGWGTLPIVVDETTDFSQIQDDDGNLAVQSGAPVINSTEQVMLQGVKNKRWRITIPRFATGPTLFEEALAGGSP